ncbi:hypothetical protein [Caldisphaera sp.]|uniref:hypothetical protein n=1 Tax=Caldisphaera sp. TaxID=2060322 RepID=UPI0025BD9803|nr:hypothetical protein [Caldisphaera sp.]
MNIKVPILLSLIFIIFLMPLVGHAYQSYQYSQLYIDEYGDLSGYFIVNVTNAPTVVTINIPGNISAYEAVSGNTSLPVTINRNNVSVLVENNSIVNLSFISFNAAIQKGETFFLDIDLPSYTNLILPSNAVIIYTNATIQGINGNTISLYPGNIEIEYSIQNITTTSTTTITSTSTITSNSSTSTSSTTPPSTSISPTTKGIILYGVIGIVVVIIAIAVLLLLRRSK